MWTQSVTSQQMQSPGSGQLANNYIDELARAVNDLSNEDYQRLVSQMFRAPESASQQGISYTPERTSVEMLTARENEVLILVASGYSRKEIGATLSISENTAACHIASIYRKLDIRTIAEATLIAIRSGVIAPG